MLHKLGCEASGYDWAAYSKTWEDGMWALVGFWVDDAMAVGSEERVQELEKAVEQRFRISRSGEVHWILGTSIHRNAKSHYIYITQQDYIDSVARKFNVQHLRPVSSLLPLGIDFSAISCPKTDEEKAEALKIPYKELIGSLMFTAIVSHPDISYSVGKLVQYSLNPRHSNWNLVKQILQYLYTIKDWELHLGSKHMKLQAYSDTDFAGDLEDRKSTGSYVVFLGDRVVSWSSKKQSLVVLSSTESEYITLLDTGCEVLWVQ
jgi:hypothetical protein